MARKKKNQDEITKNSGSVGYSKKALAALESGTYDQLTGRDPKYTSSQDQTRQSRELPMLEGMTRSPEPKTTSREIDTDRARRNYERRIGHVSPDVEARNLRNRGYESSYNAMDFSNVSDFDKELLENALKERATERGRQEKMRSQEEGSPGRTFNEWLSGLMKVDEADDIARRQSYLDKYGASQNDVLDAYQMYKENEIRKAREENPLEGLKDIKTAPDRALANAAGIFTRKFFTDSDLDKMANSDLVQSKVKEVNKRRNYTYNSPKLSEGKKAIAKIANEGGDLLADLAVSALTGTPFAMGDAAAGVGMVAELNPAISTALTNLMAYGEAAGTTKEDLMRNGVDEEKAIDMANAAGLISAGSRFATAKLAARTEGANMLQKFLNGSKIGGKIALGQGALREAANKIILADESSYDADVQKYISQGMSEKEAGARAFANSLGRVGVETIIGALYGGLSGMASGGNKAAENIDDTLNSVWASQEALPQNNIPLLTGTVDSTQPLTGSTYNSVPALADNIYPIQMPGTNGIINLPGETAPIQLPDLAAKSSPIKYAAEKAVSATPRVVAKLEGQALVKAKNQVSSNNNRIKALKNEISILEKDPKSMYRGNLKKAVKQQIQAKKNEITTLQGDNKTLNRQIKGQLTPVVEQLPAADRQAVNEFKAKVRKVGNMWAGEGGKEQAKRVNAALDKYIETGKPEDLQEYAMELWQLHTSATNEYTSQAGNVSRYGDYFEGDGLFEQGISDLDSVFAKSRELNGAGLTPEVAATSVPEMGDMTRQPSELRSSNVDPAHDVAWRYADAFSKYDDYGYLDTGEGEIESGVEQMADDIMNGRDLSPYINSLEEAIDDVQNENVRAEMQGLIEELTALQNGSENNLSTAERAALKNDITNAPSRNYVDINKVSDIDKPRVIQEAKDKVNQAYSDFLSKTDNENIYKNQVKVFTVPTELADMLKKASGGTKDISNKVIAIDLGKIAHEIPRHSNQSSETSRDQIAYGTEILDKIIDTTLEPDMVENISNGLKRSLNDAFAIVKKDQGYIVIIENIGGKNNPNIIPAEVLHMTRNKLEKALNSGKSIADIVFENSERVGNIAGNNSDIKNRVTAVTNATRMSPSSNTSGTLLPSPLSNNNVPSVAPNVKSKAPDNGYWLRVLGDNDFLISEAEKQGVDPQMLIDYANKNLGYDVAPANNVPHMGGMMPNDNVPPRNNVPPVDNVEPPKGMKERGMSRHMRGVEKMQMEGVPDEVKEDFINDPDMYKVLTNASTQEKADYIYNNSEDPEADFRELLIKHDPAALPLGHQLAKDYSAEGNYEMAAQIYRDMGEQLTKTGQFSQAAILAMMKDDPMTALNYAQKEISRLNAEGKQKFGDKWKPFELTPEEIEEFNQITPGDEESIQALYDKIGQRLGREYPTTLLEKMLEGRKIAMLFNPRTVSRNFLANPPTLAMRWVSDRIEALGQGIVHLIDPSFERTQAITGSGIRGRKLAKQFLDSEAGQRLINGTTGKYEVPDIKGSLTKDKQMYKGTAISKWVDRVTGNGINRLAEYLNEHGHENDVHVEGGIQALNEKLFDKKGVQSTLETIRNITYGLLELGDTPFVRENFIERLGSYINAQNIKSLDEIPEEAVMIAWEEAMKATYKDNSWAVQMLSGIKKGMEKVPVVGKPLSQATIPFVQAPGNIPARMVDYSAIRGSKGVADVISGAKKNDYDKVRRGIEEIAKGMTGALGIWAGMKLYQSGVLTGDWAQNLKEKAFQQLDGFKPWAIHVGDKYFKYDWAQPGAEQLIIGTLLQQAIDNSDEYDSDILRYFGIEDSKAGKVIGAMSHGTKEAVNSWFEQSPLQGLMDLMKGNSGQSTDMAQNLVDVGTGDFAGALFPAVGNAMAKTLDTTARQTTDPSNSFASYINQQMAKIPKVSENLPAKYDVWGNEVKYANSKGEAFLQRFVIPGEYGTESNDLVNKELKRILNDSESHDEKVFPFYAPKKVGDKKLTNKEVSEYQKDMGQRSRKFVESFLKSDQYKKMTDDERTTALYNLYQTSKAITERDLFGKDLTDNSQWKKYVNAYDEAGGGDKGIDAVVNYSEAKSAMKSAGVTASSNLGKEVEKAVKSGDTKKVEEITTAAKSVEDLGFTKIGPKETYVKASSIDPTLSLEDFAETYRAIDSNSNEGITQKEMIEYFNNNHYTSENQAMRDWEMYAPKGKKLPYLKKDGTWGAK